MNCPNCNRNLDPDMKFCPNCGRPVSGVSFENESQTEYVNSEQNTNSEYTEQPNQQEVFEQSANTTEEASSYNQTNSSCEQPYKNNNYQNQTAAQRYCERCGTPLNSDTIYCPNCGFCDRDKSRPNQPKSKVAAGLLGIFLGGLGIHNFYLGYNSKALTQLLLTVIGIPLCCLFVGFFMITAASIWGFIEGIFILTGYIDVDGYGNRLSY